MERSQGTLVEGSIEQFVKGIGENICTGKMVVGGVETNGKENETMV